MSNETHIFNMASIVIPTFDRPNELPMCLDELSRHRATIPFEIIVVDNHPASGLTPPVVARFPQIKLVSQTLKGISYARNAGILASEGDVVLFIDDDIFVTEHWLDNMLAGFTHDNVMAVTGRVVPYSLATHAEQLFETYVSFDRGTEQKEFGSNWFRSFWKRSVPTQYVGGGGNSAVRKSAFADPNIGLFNERLGAGSPVGSAEDQYCFYEILKAGYSIVYQPTAVVRHKHRGGEADLYKQMLAYGKAVVGYELECLVNDHDWRSLLELVGVLPIWHVRQFVSIALQGLKKHQLPEQAKLVMTDIYGNMLGFSAWLRSRQRLKTLGASPALKMNSYASPVALPSYESTPDPS